MSLVDMLVYILIKREKYSLYFWFFCLGFIVLFLSFKVRHYKTLQLLKMSTSSCLYITRKKLKNPNLINWLSFVCKTALKF